MEEKKEEGEGEHGGVPAVTDIQDEQSSGVQFLVVKPQRILSSWLLVNVRLLRRNGGPSPKYRKLGQNY